LIILIILFEEYKSSSSSLCSFLHPLITSSLFSCTLGLCSSLNIREQVSYPYRTTGKNVFMTSICNCVDAQNVGGNDCWHLLGYSVL
jgi:hypothetical protein